MSISKFYTTTIAVARITWSGESSAEVSQGSFLGHIQQIRPELAEQLGVTLTQTFSIWCDEDTNVQVGDTLTISTGDYSGTYSIKHVQTNATGNHQHLELVVEKDVIT